MKICIERNEETSTKMGSGYFWNSDMPIRESQTKINSKFSTENLLKRFKSDFGHYLIPVHGTHK